MDNFNQLIMKELFEDRNYWFGLTFGLFLLMCIICETLETNQWHWIYIAPYIVMSFCQLIVAGDDNEESTHTFLLGMNIPIFLAIILLFFIVDSKHNYKKSKIQQNGKT